MMTPALFTEWREAAGGRRFLLTLGAQIINTGLFMLSMLSEQGYLTTFTATVGMYLVANGWQRHQEAKSNGNATPQATPAP